MNVSELEDCNFQAAVLDWWIRMEIVFLNIERVYCFTITAQSVMIASATTLEVQYVN